MNIVTSTPVRPGTRTAIDKDSFLRCKDHQSTKLCIKTCDKCILLLEQEKLPQGRLSTTSQVLAYYLTMNKNNVKTNNLVDAYSDVMLHWVLRNVYTVTQKAVLTKLEQIVETYRNLEKYPRKKRRDTYFKNNEKFRVECGKLFDIKCHDQKRIKDQEKEEDLLFDHYQTLVPQVSP